MKKKKKNKPLYISSIATLIIGGLVWFIHIYIGTFILLIGLMLFIASKKTDNIHQTTETSVPTVPFASLEQPPHEEVSNHAQQKACFLDILENQYVLSYRYDFVKVAMPNVNGLKLGDFLSLEAEPDNQYDSHAVKILSGLDTVGYLFRGKLQNMANDFIRKDLPIEVSVDSITNDSFTCGLGFYKDMNSFNCVSATLTKTSKKDYLGASRQDNLSSTSEGDMLYLDYDYDSETYIVTDDFGNELGELSKSVSSKLYDEESNYKYIGICTENEIDDNLKYKCKIKILKISK